MNITKSPKDWTGNSIAYITTAGFANNRTHNRQEHDYYATEPRAVELLLDLDDFSDVWECAAGGGHMSNVLEERGLLSRISDKYPQRSDIEELDFLTNAEKWGGDIITNPPYRYAGDFIRSAMERLADGHKLALFLPIRYLSSKSRRKLFDTYPPYKVWVSSGKLKCAMNGDFDSMKGSAMDYCWVIWHKGYKGETKLGWFN